VSKEYYYLVRWTEALGWEVAADTEGDVLPDGTIFDVEAGEWQVPYLGDGKFNGKEKELSEQLLAMLDQSNRVKEGEEE
jgi:hypothetical protein